MYILGFLIVLLIGLWFLSLSVHIGVTVHQFYFETEVMIRILGQRLFRRKWQGDWLDRLSEKLKESSNVQEIEKDNEGKARGIVPKLLQIGRWKKFVWRVELGLDDAMITAIVAGCIWGLQGIIEERLIHDKKCATVISCRPNFGKMILQSEIICIVHFRFGDIIKEFIQGYLKSQRRSVA